MSKKARRIAICLITDSHDNILMGKRKDCGLWCLPAGGADKGESMHDAAIRELKEESGLDVEDIKLVKVEYNPKKHIMLYLFKITVDPTQEFDMSHDPSDEFSKLEYKDPNDMHGKMTVKAKENIALKYWVNN